ncbi:MAG TPA: DUF2188 domain-containing protein [Gammaproteobacteria bacterium]|nr:DUF2188 domain-containing protein [Gammaproteobacteria bacterium]
MPPEKPDYPPEMAHLDPDARSRAAKLAKQLEEEGYPEQQAIRTAIGRMTQEDQSTAGGHVAPTDPEKYVTPHEEGWAVVSPTGEHQTSLYASKEEALEKARELARKEHSRLHIENGHERVIDPDDKEQ